MENKKVAIYCRVARKDRDEIEKQKERLTQYCLFNKYEIYKIYEDIGFSGLDNNRPSYNELLNDLKKNEFDEVVVWSLNSLEKNISKLFTILDLIDNSKCDLISLSENINLQSTTGHLFKRMLEIFSLIESDENE